MLDKYLKQYETLLFGTQTPAAKKDDVTNLYNNVSGYRKKFLSKKYKPKVGKKFTKEFNNVNMIELIKGNNT